jgi:hypothetical protein
VCGAGGSKLINGKLVCRECPRGLVWSPKRGSCIPCDLTGCAVARCSTYTRECLMCQSPLQLTSLTTCSETVAFQSQLMSSTPIQYPVLSQLVDMNDDGQLDLAFCTAKMVGWFEHIGGANTFASEPRLLLGSPTGPTPGYYSMRIKDFGAGTKTLAAGMFFGAAILLVPTNVSHATPTVMYQGPSLSAVTHVDTCDVNNDGLPDLLWAQASFALAPSNDALFLAINLGNLTFAPPIKVRTNDKVRVQPRISVCFDANNDGFKDIAVTSSLDNTVKLFLNNGNGTFPIDGLDITRDATMVTGLNYADLNGDGFLDLVYAGTGDGILRWSVNINGTGRFSARPLVIGTGLSSFQTVGIDILDGLSPPIRHRCLLKRLSFALP